MARNRILGSYRDRQLDQHIHQRVPSESDPTRERMCDLREENKHILKAVDTIGNYSKSLLA